jgi:hypothetical protein
MPVIGEFHEQYWDISSTAVTPIARPAAGGYPQWQTSVTLGSVFGGALIFWERFVDWVGWAWTLLRRSHRYDWERRAVVLHALDALEHPAYPIARLSVRKTATTLGFNRPEAWKELSRELKGDPGRAENAFRHLEAMRLMRANNIQSTLANPQANLIVELAYHGFAVNPRGDV